MPQLQEEQVHFLNNPTVDDVQPYIDDLYFATARPRQEGDLVCLRRQRINASAAAGALANALAGNDPLTNKPPRVVDKVGDENERVDLLEHGARMLIRRASMKLLKRGMY